MSFAPHVRWRGGGGREGGREGGKGRFLERLRVGLVRAVGGTGGGDGGSSSSRRE